jgi:hypothetical protein
MEVMLQTICVFDTTDFSLAVMPSWPQRPCRYSTQVADVFKLSSTDQDSGGEVCISLACILWDVKLKSLCLTKHHAMKVYWGSGGIAPRILDLGTRWR